MGVAIVPIVSKLTADDERAAMRVALGDDDVVMGSRGALSVPDGVEDLQGAERLALV
jgi:hypothetical protein